MSTYDDKTNYMGTGINLTDVPPLTPEGWEKLVLSETLGSLAEGASANSVSTARQALAAYRAEWDRKYNISLDKVVENADAMAAKGDMTGINARARLNAYRVDVESAQLRAQLDKPSRVHSAANDKTALQVRAVVRAGLKKIQQAITAGIHYPAMHLFSLYRQYGYKPGDFPNAERIGEQTITLPLFPGMEEKDVDLVCSAIISLLNGNS